MNEERINAAIISEYSTIRHAMESLNISGLQICLLCRSNRQVIGVITDGDIRRGLLRGMELSSPAMNIINTSFMYVRHEEGYRHSAETLAHLHNINHVPVLEEDGRLCDIVISSRNLRHEAKDNVVVVMAGGLGTRLRPLTENCPKPLLRLGGRPLLENIILSFKLYGFSRFFISINYLGEMISDYFGDGSTLGVDIRYLQENKRLGTAGALSLIPEKLNLPFIVINGDILMKADMDDLICHHVESKVMATMCVRQYNTKIPYGVISTDGNYITCIHEKPIYRHLINAGLYCLEPDVIDYIQSGEYIDMTTLFEKIYKHDKKLGTYIFEGEWFDIGNIEDYRSACENAAQLLPIVP